MSAAASWRQERCKRCPWGGCGGAWFAAVSEFAQTPVARRTVCVSWRSICIVTRCVNHPDECLERLGGLLPCPPLPYSLGGSESA